MTTADFEYVDTPEALAGIVEAASAAPTYALDTEFHRETTYFAKVCLVQLAFLDRVVLFSEENPRELLQNSVFSHVF